LVKGPKSIESLYSLVNSKVPRSSQGDKKIFKKSAKFSKSCQKMPKKPKIAKNCQKVEFGSPKTLHQTTY
jgi:hypothetical protein